MNYYSMNWLTNSWSQGHHYRHGLDPDPVRDHDHDPDHGHDLYRGLDRDLYPYPGYLVYHDLFKRRKKNTLEELTYIS